MQISVKYTDYDRTIKESELEFDGGATQTITVKETVVDTEPLEEPDVDGGEVEQETIKTLNFNHYDGINNIESEMTYKEMMEYIALLTKMSKQIKG